MEAFGEHTQQQVNWGCLMVRYCYKIAKDTRSIINLAEANLLYPKSLKKGERQLTMEQLACTHARVQVRSNQHYKAKVCVACGVRLHVNDAPTIVPTMPWAGEAGKRELRALLKARPLPFHQITARPNNMSRPNIPPDLLQSYPQSSGQGQLAHRISRAQEGAFWELSMKEVLQTLIASEAWWTVLEEEGQQQEFDGAFCFAPT